MQEIEEVNIIVDRAKIVSPLNCPSEAKTYSRAIV
jgi:hypothetical protein